MVGVPVRDRGRGGALLSSYRYTVIAWAQVGSMGDVCPLPETSGARTQRQRIDLSSRTGVFGTVGKTNHPAFAATQHREAPS